MENVIDLINNISSFIQYFATGYLFFSAYNFSGCLFREKEKEYFFVKSITASFIIYAIATVIFSKTKWDQEYYFVTLIIFSCVIGLILGRARSFGWVNTLCQFLFRQTITDNIFLIMWNSVSKGHCLCIRFRKDGDTNFYEGQILDISDLYQDPIFRLKYYVIMEKDRSILKDYSRCSCAQMVVKWSEMKDIEIASDAWGENSDE